MPVVGKLSRNFTYRCDAASCGEMALKPYEMLTMTLVAVSSQVMGDVIEPSVGDGPATTGVVNETDQLNILSLIAEQWAPLTDSNIIYDKEEMQQGETTPTILYKATDYSRIMLSGKIENDNIVPYTQEDVNKPKKAIKITPVILGEESLTEKQKLAAQELYLKWVQKPKYDESTGDLIIPAGEYWDEKNETIKAGYTAESLMEKARQEVTPLVKIELFDDYVYQPAKRDDNDKLIQQEYLELDNPAYTDMSYWTQSKLKQHGFLTEAPNLMWQ